MILTLIPAIILKPLNISDGTKWRINTFFSAILTIIILYYIVFIQNSISLFGFKIGGFCIFKRIINLPCPVCGLTHSINSALHLNIMESLYYHPLGLPILISLLIPIFYRILTFSRLIPYLSLEREILFAKKIDSHFFSILVCFWVINNLVLKGGRLWQ